MGNENEIDYHGREADVDFTYVNRDQIPKRNEEFEHIYRVTVYAEDGEILVGYGRSVDMEERLPKYKSHVKLGTRDGSGIIRQMQKLTIKQDFRLKFTAEFVEQVPRAEASRIEARYAELDKAAGKKVLNSDNVKSTPPQKSKKPKNESKSKSEKTPKAGGWLVNAAWYGQGRVIKCTHPFDGTYWETEHDPLLDKVNESLTKKNKEPVGSPGKPSFSASSGLRCPELWRRVNDEIHPVL